MPDIFARIILGHLMGDYLLQSKKMALKKSEKGINGMLWCFLHSSIYTLSVCLFLWEFNLWLLILVFISHYPIDRWSLATKWLKMIKGRDLKTVYQSQGQYREIDLTFSCIVYTIPDNSMHLILLWLITKVI
ncbi:MAG: hypothetical protein COV55_02695 [Candidatus Komeilibacteria bacterium CG11_big_fil_rev_8_21_14_0_20_36_20]|uniref:DUF3307 domain-containing protein n=1 Tax=Candidatus Komeilibacteria bacterium CG11_big_fil_rev_8_21_14_0_20_36_20 TaxID=1974477 RepID=A0A2H0NCW9_9BACT|nr:MAG: hypothetical protein COV55_02695 [Candidatus Komeilibacteria bacterium CG11_big_fil_rev_8_21_14_0_20_36_20]PIR81489.1 MAG: hypothetical protein COU21_03215 [Candidatus Komeilibacteria bacterium CG10_big_fil_rev_8_21_14_0_10_36_65]PJC55735.1 MAG: hypothetical protein CO027_00605 [Candidatus Komeilibacteria bacterium CG_4_9_14_0_2_um_filter_36_13]